MNNLRIEIKYAVLINLLILLWYAVGFMVNLQEEPLIAYHYILNILVLFFIMVICCGLAIRDKEELVGSQLNAKQIFATGALASFFAAVLSGFSELIFNKIINPDFLDARIEYAIKTGKAKDYQEAAMILNMMADIIATGLGVFVFGTLIAAVMAWRMHTEK
jgi:hypothetical protein